MVCGRPRTRQRAMALTENAGAEKHYSMERETPP